MDKKIFLNELAALLDKHKVAVCSKRVGNCSQVFFQHFDWDKNESEDIFTGRTHSTAYEILCIASKESE